MNLLKSSSLTFLATAIRLSVAFVLNKIVSVFIGPTGLAMLGQFQNLLQISLIFSTGAINSGVVKYISENNGNYTENKKIIETSLFVSISSSLICSLILFLSSNDIAIFIFGDENYAYIVEILSATIIFFSLNQLFMSVLNGEREIIMLTKVNILQSIVSLFASLVLINLYSIDGALIALAINQSLVFLLVILSAIKRVIVKYNIRKLSYDKTILLKLLHFSFMAITTAIVSPSVMIWVRGFISDTLSFDDAGYWQAMFFFSSTYLMLITTSLSTYFLPKLSSCTSSVDINYEIKNGLKLVLPVLITISVFIYFSREIIIITLFSKEFMIISEMFKYQLVGDVFKIVSWFFSYLMLAKSITKSYIFCEVFFSVTLCAFIHYFITNFGLLGASLAYTLNYFLYMIATIFFTKKYWKVNA